MTVVAAYRQARHEEEVARLRRGLALRAMVASGMSQREIAAELGVSQPAVSQQLKVAQDLAGLHPETLIEAAGPVPGVLPRMQATADSRSSGRWLEVRRGSTPTST